MSAVAGLPAIEHAQVRSHCTDGISCATCSCASAHFVNARLGRRRAGAKCSSRLYREEGVTSSRERRRRFRFLPSRK